EVRTKEEGMSKRVFARIAALACVAVAAFTFVACGDDDNGEDDSTGAVGPPTATTASGPGPASVTASNGAATSTGDLSGNVEIDGSSTVFPITEAVAEEFMNVAPDVRVPVGVSGTGGGFSRFCTGETDISNASRPIRSGPDSEAASCEANGVEFIELPVAY